jgi:hypothetical protein
MKQQYTFSFYGQKKVASIEHPKWFQFWKKAKLVETNYHCRKHISLELTEKEMNVLSNYISYEDSLLYKLTFANWNTFILNKSTGYYKPNSMQLELHSLSSNYIATEDEKEVGFRLIEPAQTNFIINSINNK